MEGELEGAGRRHALPDRATLRERFSTEWPQVVRIIIAPAVGWQICRLIDPTEIPIFAVVVPLMAMRDQPFSALNVSFDRLVGVIAGVLLGILVVGLLGVTALAAAVVLAVGLLGGVVLRLGPTLNIQVSLSALLVFTSADPNRYGFTRLWETLIGGVVTVALSPFLFPPDATKQYRAELRRVCRRLSEHLAQAAALVEDAARNHEVLVALLEDVRQTQHSANALPASLESARRAVRNNPLRRRRIGELDVLVDVTGTVVEVSRWVTLLVEELVDLSARRDVDPLWATSGAWLSRVLRPVAAVLEATLVRDATESGEKATLTEATDALRRWREADKHPIAVVLRRPPFRLIRVVAALTGEEIVVIPGGPSDRTVGDLIGDPPPELTHDEDATDTTRNRSATGCAAAPAPPHRVARDARWTPHTSRPRSSRSSSPSRAALRNN